jgi:hypothetical protein
VIMVINTAHFFFRILSTYYSTELVWVCKIVMTMLS